MKSLIPLLVLAQLWACHSIPLQSIAPVLRLPKCDDPEVEEAALAAVDYINQHLHQGYKHTLNRIDKVKVWPRVSEPAVQVLLAQLWVPKDQCKSTQRGKFSACLLGGKVGADGGQG